MKKYTYSNLNWFLMSLIIPILLFFFAMNSVYAFFTATAPGNSSSIETATLKIDMENLSANYLKVKDVDETANKTWINLTTTETVLPGYTFQINGTATNSGSESMYTLVRLQVFVGDETTATETLFYTITETNSNGDTMYAYSKAITTLDASAILPAQKTATFSLEYKLPFGSSDTSADEGKNVKFVVSAGGIQTRSLNATAATGEIITILD